MQKQSNNHKIKFESLNQARAEIDELDQHLVALLATRQEYVDQAMRFKSAVQDVQSPERVSQVILHVRGLAEQQGVDPILVEKIYREMIQYSIQRELKQIRP